MRITSSGKVKTVTNFETVNVPMLFQLKFFVVIIVLSNMDVLQQVIPPILLIDVLAPIAVEPISKLVDVLGVCVEK